MVETKQEWTPLQWGTSAFNGIWLADITVISIFIIAINLIDEGKGIKTKLVPRTMSLLRIIWASSYHGKTWYYTGFAQAWKVLEYTALCWKVLEKYLKNTQRPWKVLEFCHFQENLTLSLETYTSWKLWCLNLVQHMLHQIKTPQLSTNFLKLISLIMQSSISEIEFRAK